MNNELCIKLQDFEKICRICLEFIDCTTQIDLFSSCIEMIQQIASIQVTEDDELPHQVCNNCFKQLQSACLLRKQCEKSDLHLRYILEVDRIKQEDDAQLGEMKCEDEVDIKSESNESLLNNDIKSDSDSDYAPKRKKKIQVKKIVTEEKKMNDIVCNVCNKQFLNIHRLKSHQYTHMTERPFTCTECGNAFKNKYSLSKHISMIHKRTQAVICDTCGKTVQRKYLRQHINMIHGDKRVQFTCNLCPKQFTYKVSLDKHVQRVHENQPKKYSVLCNICGRGVESVAYLKIHLRTHTGEKPYECNTCDKKYRRKEALHMHVERVHLDKRTHHCTICMRSFYDKKILAGHMRTHTGERPYQCQICQRRFGHHAALWTHTKIHHSDNVKK